MSEPGSDTARHTCPVLVPPLSGVARGPVQSAFRRPEDAFNARWRPRAGSQHEGLPKDLGGPRPVMLGHIDPHLPGTEQQRRRPCESRCQRVLRVSDNESAGALLGLDDDGSRTASYGLRQLLKRATDCANGGHFGPRDCQLRGRRHSPLKSTLRLTFTHRHDRRSGAEPCQRRRLPIAVRAPQLALIIYTWLCVWIFH
jgi:hypothetical protein